MLSVLALLSCAPYPCHSQELRLFCPFRAPLAGSPSTVFVKPQGRGVVLGGFTGGVPRFPKHPRPPSFHQELAKVQSADAAGDNATWNSPPEKVARSHSTTLLYEACTQEEPYRTAFLSVSISL